MAPHTDNRENTSRHELVPAGPNRTAAHRRKGIGKKIRMGQVWNPRAGPAKTVTLTTRSAVMSRAASRIRRREIDLSEPRPRLPQLTITGTMARIASTLARNRLRQISQYVPLPQPSHFTKPTSTKDDSIGASNAANTTKILTRLTVSSSIGSSISIRMNPAPIRASVQLLTYQASTIGSGTPPCSSDVTWTGNTARRTTGHIRNGTSSNAPRRIALGGQSVDTGSGAGVRRSPSFAPR